METSKHVGGDILSNFFFPDNVQKMSPSLVVYYIGLFKIELI